MNPLVSIGWFGSVTKFPGRTLASAGMNRPPAAASKMLTLMTSPIPNVISGGGRWSPKIPVSDLGPNSSKDVDSLGRQRYVTIGRAMPGIIGPNNDRVRSRCRHKQGIAAGG